MFWPNFDPVSLGICNHWGTMTTIILSIHLFLAIAMVVCILLQRSEGGALGIGGSSGGGGGGGGMMSSRAQANLLTRATAILAASFMATSLILAIMSGHSRKPSSVLDQGPLANPGAPAKSGTPAVPAKPGAPLGR
jgi:preprotein translocase subunit SecG